MNVTMRLVGLLIALCGLAVCYGAMQLWPTEAFTQGLGVLALLRILGAVVAAIAGVGNTFAGLVILFRRTGRA